MAFGELFSAMQQKVVDGQENPWGTIFLQNFFEVQKFAPTRDMSTRPSCSLSRRSSGKTARRPEKGGPGRRRPGEGPQPGDQPEMNAEYLEKLKEKMDVTILTPEQKAAFQQACQPIYDQFGKDIGEDLIKEVQKLSSEYKK